MLRPGDDFENWFAINAKLFAPKFWEAFCWKNFWLRVQKSGTGHKTVYEIDRLQDWTFFESQTCPIGIWRSFQLFSFRFDSGGGSGAAVQFTPERKSMYDVTKISKKLRQSYFTSYLLLNPVTQWLLPRPT